MMTKQEATRRGKALLARMKTKGWKLRVWENLGWHYSLERPPLSVYPLYREEEESPSVGIMMTNKADESGWGYPCWDYKASNKDPNKAVEAQIKEAQEYVNQLQAALDAARREP